MCGSTVDIQSATAEISRGKKERLAATLRGSRPGCNPHHSLWRHW